MCVSFAAEDLDVYFLSLHILAFFSLTLQWRVLNLYSRGVQVFKIATFLRVQDS